MLESKDLEEQEKEWRNLVLETRSGNDESYNKLLTHILPFIRRNIGAQMSRYGYVSQAEDVVQEVLIAVHLKLHTYNEELPFVAWLRAVMKYKAIDMLRRQKNNVISLDEHEYLEPAVDCDTELGVIHRDLRSLLDKLKPPAGEIIYDMKVVGISIKELAVKYNLSESNVKVLVHRGLKRLSELVRER